jgi:flagellar hook-length control protein FliK
MPLQFDAVSEMLAVTKQHLHQFHRIEPDQEASQGVEFYDQLARIPAAEPSESTPEDDRNSDPDASTLNEKTVELDEDAILGSDPARMLDERSREIAIATPQPTPRVPTDPQPPVPVSSKQNRQKTDLDRVDASARRDVARKPEVAGDDNARNRAASLLPTVKTGTSKNDRVETVFQSRPPAAPQIHDENSTLRTEQKLLGPEPPKRISKESDPEIANAKNAEGPRTKRRSDRSSSRSRPSSDGSRESTERPQRTDSPNESRPAAARGATMRESASTQSADSTLQRDAAAIRPPQSIPIAPNPTIDSTTAVPVSTPAVKSVSASSNSLRTVSQIASSESITQGTPSASPAANVTSPSETPRSTNESQGSSGTRLSQYQENKLVQRVLRGMEQLANGGGQVRMRLHPPELGSLQLSLRIEGTTVFAEMQVETTSARDALMKNLPILKDRLAEQGMQIQQFDVRADGNFDGGNFNGSSRSGNGGGDSNSDRQSSRYVTELQNRLPDTSGASAADLVRRWTRTHGMLDFEA